MAFDPLSNPEPLIRRVYAYAAYRLGDGPDAEDATNDTFERALRYRSSYDRRKGPVAAWLIGIARHCVDDLLSGRDPAAGEHPETAAPGELEGDTLRRLEIRSAVLALDERSRDLVALRYGADLTARQIAALLGERTNTVEVALHRALGRLRLALEGDDPSAGGSTPPVRRAAEDPAP